MSTDKIIMKNKPDILLITIDCLRPDHLGCYGYAKKTSPNIDAFAGENIIFDNCITNGSSTFFSFPAIMASTYTLMQGNKVGIWFAKKTLPEVLSENGYHTIGINAANIAIGDVFGYGRGLDEYKSFISPLRPGGKIAVVFRKALLKHERVFAIARNARNSLLGGISDVSRKLSMERRVDAPRIEKVFCDFISHKNGKPFFCWLHFMDTHDGYETEKYWKEFADGKTIEEDKETMRKALLNRYGRHEQEELKRFLPFYDGGVKKVDGSIGRILRLLKENGIYDNMLIIITADHGEEFGEHGNFTHLAKLYDELLKVPLIIKIPEMEGKRVKPICQLMDLPPTILEVAGIKVPDEFRGISLKRMMNGEKADRVIISETLLTEDATEENPRHYMKLEEGGCPLVSARDLEWKCIHNPRTGKYVFFDLKADPGEKNPTENPPGNNKERFRNIIESHMRAEEENRKQLLNSGNKGPVLDSGQKQEIKNRLQELGYY